jgi:MoaA/NifB/PqqE/SkfB family radical SAM enzyme
MHSNLWKLCRKLRSKGIKITLHTTGITLKANAAEVIQNTDEAVVSLDGSPLVHNRIRNTPGAFEDLSEGVQELKDIDPDFKITGRCVIQKGNYNHFTDIIATAKSLELDQISFVAADVSSASFTIPGNTRKLSVELDEKEVREFEKIIKDSIHQFTELFHSKYIVESPEQLLDIVTYFKAILGTRDFSKKKCNAPWISAVIEANGDVRPCLFHPPYGNIHQQNLSTIINSSESIVFRKKLNTEKNPVCERCVRAVNLKLTESVQEKLF